MKNRSVATAIGGCLFFGVHTSVAATNDLEQVDASRIVVTATRNPADLRDIPSNPTVITAQEITAGRYRSVTEALSKQAGLHFSNFADNPARAHVSLRGFGENSHGRVLVLLNGRKLNQMDMAGVNWAQVPIQAVDRIEVVRGANSVLYGNHAVGGVINIITRDGTEEPQTTVTASAGSHAAVDLTAVTSGSLDGLGYVATLGHQSGDGYRDRSRYKTHSGSVRLSGPVNDQLSAYAEASIVREKHQLPGHLTLDQVRANRRQAGNPSDEARSTHLQFQTGIEALLSDVTVFNLDAGISRKEIEADWPSRENPAWGTPPEYLDYLLMGYSLSPKLTFLTPIAGMENELIIGTDLSRETLRTDRFNDAGRTLRAADTRITKDVAGAYIADTLSLTDQLHLSAGARIERNRVEIRHQSAPSYHDRIRQNEEAWETALTWLPTDEIKLFVGVSRTYRYPFVDEQAIYTGWGDAFNPDLKPETGMNYETGIELTPFENTTLQATLFRLDMKDEIAWGAGQNENLDETTRHGVELAAGYRQDLFAIHAFYTWMQAEFAKGPDKGNSIPWVPKNKVDLTLDLFLTDALTFRTHVGYTGSMYASGDNANTGDHKQSGYTLVDLLLQYTFTQRRYDATLFAGIDNLFATKYNHLVSWGGYYPAPERTFKAGLSVTF